MTSRLRVPILDQHDWQMSGGERAALEGLLTQVTPMVAIELGTHKGGSLRRLAVHSGEVHTFDLTLQIDPADYPSATFHIGDSHVLLSKLLSDLHTQGKRVEFSLVDGDHSPSGVRRDLEDLLSSDAVGTGVILLHDMGNDAVRRAVESLEWQSFSKVAEVNLDFVPTSSPAVGGRNGWAGFGLIRLDANRDGDGARPQRVPSTTTVIQRTLRELRRRARRSAGLLLRRLRVHPAQRASRAKRSMQFQYPVTSDIWPRIKDV